MPRHKISMDEALLISMGKVLLGKKILVVEDEVIVLMMLEGMLGDMGCEAVYSASTNQRAIELIGSQTFDAAMLDMNLNGKSSVDVADALAESGVPFVYATGNSIQDDREGFRNRPILRKPFGDAEFSRMMLALLIDKAA
jgi:CheY-like chemotaxis protein